MSNTRQQKRKQEAELNAIFRKAKLDMQTWVSSLTRLPSESEIKAYQSGYIAGINRGSSLK
jgi:hypothetical protein